MKTTDILICIHLFKQLLLLKFKKSKAIKYSKNTHLYMPIPVVFPPKRMYRTENPPGYVQGDYVCYVMTSKAMMLAKTIP